MFSNGTKPLLRSGDTVHFSRKSSPKTPEILINYPDPVIIYGFVTQMIIANAARFNIYTRIRRSTYMRFSLDTFVPDVCVGSSIFVPAIDCCLTLNLACVGRWVHRLTTNKNDL